MFLTAIVKRSPTTERPVDHRPGRASTPNGSATKDVAIGSRQQPRTALTSMLR